MHVIATNDVVRVYRLHLTLNYLYPFGRICYPTVLNIGKQRSLSEGDSKCKSLSEGKSNCNPIICFP